MFLFLHRQQQHQAFAAGTARAAFPELFTILGGWHCFHFTEKEMKHKGGIYHRTQIDLTYNSNHIEGSRLSHEQTRYIFETNTIA